MTLDASFGEVDASLTDDRRTVMIGTGGTWLHSHRFCRDSQLRTMSSPADLRAWIERRYGELMAELRALRET